MSDTVRFMKRGGWLAALAALTVGLGLAAAACGSGGAPEDQDGEPASTGTVRSEREARQASIMQQQGQSEESATAAEQDGQDGQDEQIDVSSDGRAAGRGDRAGFDRLRAPGGFALPAQLGGRSGGAGRDCGVLGLPVTELPEFRGSV